VNVGATKYPYILGHYINQWICKRKLNHNVTATALLNLNFLVKNPILTAEIKSMKTVFLLPSFYNCPLKTFLYPSLHFDD